MTTASNPLTDRILVLCVFVIASCGLGYELVSTALSSYLLGDSIWQFSTLIGTYLFAMGVGSHLSRYVTDDKVLPCFIQVELLIALLGGFSAALLFAIFAWTGPAFRSTLYALVFLVGAMVGLEIPLVMRLLHRKQGSFSELVSKVLTFDYLGALAVAVLFPLWLAPHLGLVRTSLLFGLTNALIALWTMHVFRAELPRPSRWLMQGGVVVFVLAIGMTFAGRLTLWGERQLYGDEVVHRFSSPYQKGVITRWKNDIRLYINGNLQFSSKDEHRYHEALVHPALTTLPWAKQVLILGGGDGLAMREVLRYRHIEAVTLVDLDPAMTDLFATSAALTALNHQAFADPRVTVVNADAFHWLENNRQTYDLVVVDFPDPSNFSLGKLYSEPFYRLLSKHVAQQGLIAVQATSPYFAPRAYWTVEATLRTAGLRTWPYHVHVPSFGDWGFIMASPAARYTPPQRYTLPMRFLDAANTAEMFRFPADMPRLSLPPNQLNTQSLVRLFEEDWQQVQR